MKFSEEFRKQGRILAWDGDNVEATKFFLGSRPRSKPLCTAHQSKTRLYPKESPSSFVEGVNDSDRKQTNAHGMGEHGGENRFNKNKVTANKEGTATPPRKFHITFRNNGGKI
jgi:hypothetical protein